MTINETLAASGYTTAPRDNGRKAILLDGVEVFVGRAHEVWAWLEAGEPVGG